MSPDGSDRKPAGEVWEVVLSAAHRHQIQKLATWGFFRGEITILNAPDMCIYVQCQEEFDARWLCYAYHGVLIRTFSTTLAVFRRGISYSEGTAWAEGVRRDRGWLA